MFLRESNPHHIDSPEYTIRHKEIINSKSFLKLLYTEWYLSFANALIDIPANPAGHGQMGKILEIGSGSGFLKDICPEVITSDILSLPDCDLVCQAEKLPFGDNELRAIFMLNVLHHISGSELFFQNIERMLQPGGILFIIEPANTRFSRWIYNALHHEPFDQNAGWDFPDTGPLSGANIALPWIIFSRDIDRFHSQYPSLKLQYIKLHTPFRYLITGGLSYKSPLPGWMFGTITGIENLFFPLFHLLAMFQTIVVKKSNLS